MATPTNRPAGDNPGQAFPAGPYLTRQPARWRRNVALWAMLAGGAVLAWTWASLREEALAGSAYAARAGCACRFVSGRSLASCEGDLRAAGLGRMSQLVTLSENASTRTITAGVPLLSSQNAAFDGKGSCELEPWGD